MASLEAIEGIGPANATKLRAGGCRSTGALLKLGGTAKGRKEMAGACGISEKQLLEWVNRADLMRVKGVGTQFSDLLEAAGVDTVKELGTRKPANLAAALAETNAAKKLTRRVPTEVEVADWVGQAQKLAPAVSH